MQFDDVQSEAQTKALIQKVQPTVPISAPPIRQQSAEEAYELVLAQAGAALPNRDAVDACIPQCVLSSQPRFGNGITDAPADVGGWPGCKCLPVPADSDRDGMPDEWEEKFGVNPNHLSNGARDADNDG